MPVWSSVHVRVALESDRFDAEYFRPCDLKRRRELLRAGGTELGAIAEVLNGAATQYDEHGDLRVVRAGDLVAPFIYPRCGRAFLRARRNVGQVSVVQGDVLISSIGMGSIGKVSLVMEDTDLITVPEVTVVRKANVPAEFLFAYLRSEGGRAQMEREITGGTGQQHLNKGSVARLVIPKMATQARDPLVSAVRAAYVAELEWKRAFEEAQRVMAFVVAEGEGVE